MQGMKNVWHKLKDNPAVWSNVIIEATELLFLLASLFP